MERKICVLIFFSLLVAILTICALYLQSGVLTSKSYGFVRSFVPNFVTHTKLIDLEYNSYYLAGSSAQKSFLGNTTAPMHLLQVDINELDTQHFNLNVKNIEKLKFQSIKVMVDSPYFYLIDGLMPGIFKGKLEQRVADRFMYDSGYFNQLVTINKGSVAIRGINSSREFVLGKEKNTAPHLQFFPNLLEKQIDGIFCTDGTLLYNKQLAQLIYIYHYRNQFLCIDTNMNLLYKGNTVDTIKHAQVKLGQITSENAITMSAPPLMVNKQSCTWGDLLFVHSNLIATNESQSTFSNASVIDVYDLRHATYKGSFYLNDFKGSKMKHFQVFKNNLVAIFGRYLLIYKLDASHLNQQKK